MTEIFYRDKYGKKLQVRCPFGKRDLTNDECYSGGGKNRCEFFIRYEHYFIRELTPNGQKVSCASSIKCSCKENKIDYNQLTLF